MKTIIIRKKYKISYEQTYLVFGFKEKIIREESWSSSLEVLTTFFLRYLLFENGKSWDTSHRSPWHILP